MGARWTPDSATLTGVMTRDALMLRFRRECFTAWESVERATRTRR